MRSIVNLDSGDNLTYVICLLNFIIFHNQINYMNHKKKKKVPTKKNLLISIIKLKYNEGASEKRNIE